MQLHALLALEARAFARFSRFLDQAGVVVHRATSMPELIAAARTTPVDLILIDGDTSGGPGTFEDTTGLVAGLRPDRERPAVVTITEGGSGLRDLPGSAGEGHVLDAAWSDAVIKQAIEALVRRRSGARRERLVAARSDQVGLGDLGRASPQMQRLLVLARRVVQSDTSLLILGETGSGKERLARAIHADSRRRGGPFMAVNCGALSESLLESELFGHERGAFTGATRTRRGYFELAGGGTIFLDEIGEMPLHLQVKLLRVLDDHRILRVGGEEPIHVDVRVMAASNRDLEAEGEAGRFRADLYFRLAVVTLTVPPLRERREDIPDLVKNCLLRFGGIMPDPPSLDDGVMEMLVQYAWPGNVRELFNAMEQAVLLCDGRVIRLSDLPARITRATVRGSAMASAGTRTPGPITSKPLSVARREVSDAFERSYVMALLSETSGRVGEAARRAGINPRSFYTIMKRHGLRKDAYRSSGVSKPHR